MASAPNSPAFDPAVFRKTLGRFATGITIVTTCDPQGELHGVTVNSFTSVSLTPPLVLFCLGKSSTSLEAMLAANSFSINILSDKQEAISTRFASRLDNRFDGVEWTPGQTGSPLLAGALATLDCRKHQTIEAGDHFILIGEVLAASWHEGDPILYFGSKYRLLEPIVS
jgi:flavin reductase (DIM6/NTAB) family NADH-FMN oxidoreductase RutF